MRFNFLIVLTMVFCALCVIPVNADNDNYVYNLWAYKYNNQDIVVYNQSSIMVTCMTPIIQNHAYMATNTIINDENINGNTDYETTLFLGTTLKIPFNQYKDIYNRQIPYYEIFASSTPQTIGYKSSLTSYNTITVTFYNVNTEEYDINVDEEENIINLGTLSNLKDISLSVGSQTGQLYYITGTPETNNCTYIGSDVYPNVYYNIIIDLDENSNYAEINLNAVCNYGDASTTAKIYYDYLKPVDKIQFEIECIDYDKGLQVIGTNLTVYQYYESTNTLKYLYSNSYANGLTKITVDNNSVLFIEYDLTGYNAVNINTYEFLNNRQGKIIDANLGSARLYFSKIDPSVLLFQGFIIKDSLGSALSGVSVTMDNNQTVISNNYGGVRFDNINQGQHTFTFTKTGYYSQSLTKTVSVSNTQDILLVSSQPTTAPTIKPTPIQTDSQGNIIIDKPSNLSDSIKYSLAKIFGIESLNNINLIFAMLIILFCAVIGGVITNQSLGFVSGGLIGFVFALAVGLIPIWVFFAMVMLSVIYLVFTTGSKEGF